MRLYDPGKCKQCKKRTMQFRGVTHFVLDGGKKIEAIIYICDNCGYGAFQDTEALGASVLKQEK